MYLRLTKLEQIYRGRPMTQCRFFRVGTRVNDRRYIPVHGQFPSHSQPVGEFGRSPRPGASFGRVAQQPGKGAVRRSRLDDMIIIEGMDKGMMNSGQSYSTLPLEF
jgi:hypothetical protein